MSYKFLKYLIRIDIKEEKQVNVFLAQRFQDADIGVKMKDRYYHGRIYKKCFVGSDAVDWLVENTTAETREQALSKHFGGEIPPYYSGSETARRREIVAEQSRPQSPIRNLIKRASAMLKKINVTKKPAGQETPREPTSNENPFSPRKVVFRFPEIEPTPPDTVYDTRSQVISSRNFNESYDDCLAESDVTVTPASSASSLSPPSIIMIRDGDADSIPAQTLVLSPSSLQRVYSNLHALQPSCSSFRDLSAFDSEIRV